MQTRHIIELAAISSGALSGVMHAWQRKYDVVGVMVMGIATSMGGGMIRDILLGEGPALAIQNPRYLIAVILSVVISMFFESIFTKIEKALWIVDSLALGFFTVAGIQRALFFEIHILPALFLGITTAVCGGIMRDVLARETPIVLLPGKPHTLAALLAGLVYLLCAVGFHLNLLISQFLAVGSCFLLKIAASYYDWNVPIASVLFKKIIKSKKPNDEDENKKDSNSNDNPKV